MRFNYEHIISNSQKINNEFLICFKYKRFKLEKRLRESCFVCKINTKVDGEVLMVFKLNKKQIDPSDMFQNETGGR